MSEPYQYQSHDPVLPRSPRDDGHPPALAPDALRGEGQSADGGVHAIVTFEGRLDQLLLAPQVLRMGPERTPDDVAQAIKEAVNEAIDQLHEAIREDTGGVLGGVEDDLNRVAERFDATLGQLYSDIARAQRKIED